MCSPIPSGWRGGINTYAYVEGNPVGYFDIDGRFCLPCAAVVGTVFLYCANDYYNNLPKNPVIPRGPLYNEGGGDNSNGDPDSSNNPHPSDPNPDRNPKQDKPLSNGDINKLTKGGEHPHDLKGSDSTKDLYKDSKGNIYVKPKKSPGYGEPTGLNINDF